MKHKITNTYESIKKSPYTNYIIIAAIILFCMWIAVYSRTGGVDLEFADNYAENVVNNNIRSQITQQITAQNPLLSDVRKQQLANQQYDNYVSENQEQIQNEINTFANQLKTQFQNEDGQTYLIAIDPYYYFRYYENIITQGHPGEYTKEVDGEIRSFSTQRLAPREADVTNMAKEFHVYFSVWIYKFVNIFTTMSPLAVFFLIPAIFAALMVIPAFFLGRSFGGNLGGFLLAFLLVTHRAILSRTPAGFSDTDIYNFFFPIVVILFAILSLKAKTVKFKLINAGLSGFFLAVFATAWTGWWNIIYVVGALYGTYFLVEVITYFRQYKAHHKIAKNIDWKKASQSLWQPATFLVTLAIFITILGQNIMAIFRGIFSLIGFASLRDATRGTNIWPNVLTTVAELSPGNFSSIVNAANIGFIPGGLVLFIIATGLLLYLWKGKQEFSVRCAIVVMIIAWFLALTYATSKGVRFVMFTAMPISIGAAIALNAFTNSITRISHKELSIPSNIAKSVVILIILLVVVIPVTQSASEVRAQQLPSMNDGWHNTLTNIKENSEPDAIISSWWDFGHWFITIADRGATADGASQDKPQVHWLGKLLLSNDLRESNGILRMLHCGGNLAYDSTLAVSQDPLHAKQIVNQLVKLDENESISVLEKEGFSTEQIQNVTQYTHCDAPEGFLITSEDMGCLPNGQSCSGKTGVWAHFGGWNFTKASMWNIVSKNPRAQAERLLIEEGFASETEAASIVSELNTFNQDQANSWIYGWPGYASPMTNCQNTNGTLQCANGGQLDLTTLQASIQIQQGRIQPNSIVYVDGERGYRVVEQNPDSPLSMIVRQNGNQIQMMYASPEIAESAFTRLFYLTDGGDQFELFSDITDVQGQRIVVWKRVE